MCGRGTFLGCLARFYLGRHARACRGHLARICRARLARARLRRFAGYSFGRAGGVAGSREGNTTMMQRFCYHARGIDHIETGDPCQDAFLFARCGRYIVFGGSDGVGSRKHSERGSRLSVASSVLYVASHLTVDMTASEVEDAIRSSFSVAYHAVAELARRNGEHPRELDATLCVGVWDGKRLSWGNAGDSGIVAVLATGAYVQVTHQQHDASGGMLPLRFGPDTWEFGTVAEPVAAALIATDGLFECLCPPLMANADQPVYVPLARELMHRTETNPGAWRASAVYLRELVRSDPRFHTVDDATLLMVFDPERPPATLDDEYYAEPDWEALRQAAAERARAAWERATRHVRHAGSEARTLGGARADESCAEVSS